MTRLSSVRTCHQPHRRRKVKRGRMVSWRSRRCWCSTWKIQKPLPYKWRGPSPSSTPCCIGKQPQVRWSYPLNTFLFDLCLQQLQTWSNTQHSEYKTVLFLSVVQEAVQFCVTVCEFSVANSVSGVRRMLPLVWSTDAAIKDAVIQAYKRLYLNPQGDTVRSVKPFEHFTTLKITKAYVKQYCQCFRYVADVCINVFFSLTYYSRSSSTKVLSTYVMSWRNEEVKLIFLVSLEIKPNLWLIISLSWW